MTSLWLINRCWKPPPFPTKSLLKYKSQESIYHNIEKSIKKRVPTIYYSNQLRVFLCIIDFKLLQTLNGMIDQATIFRRSFLHNISDFCEKLFVLNDATLIVQKPFFWPKKYKTSLILFLAISLLPVFKISLHLMLYYLFYRVLYVIHAPKKPVNFRKDLGLIYVMYSSALLRSEQMESQHSNSK